MDSLGGLGLILPRFVRHRDQLIPLAAAGLVIVMSGAIGISMTGGALKPAIGPFAIGVLLAVIAYSRTRIPPVAR